MNNFVDIITIIVASYGAILSTVVYFRSVKSEKFNILVSHGYSYDPNTSLGYKGPEQLKIYAVNHGKRDMIIEILGVEIPELNAVISPSFITDVVGAKSERNKDIEKDKTLKSGEKIEIGFDYKLLVDYLSKKLNREKPYRIRPVCENTLENTFSGRWFKLGDEDC